MPLESGLSELLGKNTYKLFIYSFSMNKKIDFPAFITDFNDSFKSNWTPQEVYGRMDPVSTFKNTSRSISLSFDIPSSDLAQAIINLSNADLIIKGLYPVYTDEGKLGSAIITAPPLFRITLSNLICNAQTGEGLLGYLNGFDFKPDTNSGYFVNGDMLYPKALKASFTFNVIHEHPLGSKVVSGKHVPRITIDKKFSNVFAHKYDQNTPAISPTIAPSATPGPIPATGATTTQPTTELYLYTSTIDNAAILADERPYNEANSIQKYEVIARQNDNKYVVRSKNTNQILTNIVIPSLGGSEDGQ